VALKTDVSALRGMLSWNAGNIPIKEAPFVCRKKKETF